MNVYSPDLHAAARNLGGEVVKGGILCPGPGHSAKDRSLSVKFDHKAPDGFVVHSFAGDDPIACKDYVRAKLGFPQWEPTDAPSDIMERIAERARGIHATRPATHPLDFNDAGPQGGQRRTYKGKPIVAEYIYRQADGTPYLRVNRLEPKGDFPQEHWTGSGWAWGKPKGPKVPYRLPEMLAAVHDTVFVCEGEKDADALAERGFVATTCSEGAGKWSPDLNEWFRGKTVFILADNDEAGADHARKAAESLAGIAATVRIVNLPGLPEKGDVSDWLAAGGDTAGLVELCGSFPIFTRSEAAARDYGDAAPEGCVAGAREDENAPTIRTAAELRRKEFAPIRYVVPGLIAEGCTLLAGRPKLGKSWLMLDVGLAVAAGRICLGETQCEQGDVLYLALEDNERRLQGRIDRVLGAFAPEWPAAFHYATEWPRANDGGIAAIRNWIAKAKNPRLVVVDVLAMFKPVRGDKETLYEADYNAIKGLQALAGEFNIAIVVVHHTRKSGAEHDPFEKVSGTLGLSGAADTTLVLDRDGNGATLYGRGRDVEEIEVAVKFDRDLCRWRILGKAEEVRRTDERAVILDTLKEADEPLSPSDLSAATGMPNLNVRQLLFKMAKAGEVVKTGRGRYAHPDNSQNTDNNDNKITNLDAYRAAKDGGDDA